jgi:pyrroline-5-carboxylate reductase
MSTSLQSDDTLSSFDGSLVLVGAGHMGSALMHGWLARGLAPSRLSILEPRPMPEVTAVAARGVKLTDNVIEVGQPSAIVVAIKPQAAPEVLPGLRRLIRPDTLVISIMAGRSIASIASMLGDVPIVRTMSNTPAAIGRGITVAVPNGSVTREQRDVAQRLMAAGGKVEWVDDEALLDAVTAVSGSGPAYVFLLSESLARAGVAAGLPEDLAQRLARETVAGSGELLHRSLLDAATLRQNVTSPGGTTAAALQVLMAQDGLDPLMGKAVAAATRRSRELGS